MKQPTAILYDVRQLVRAIAALVLTAWTLPGFAAPDWDIIGIKIGMTEAQVREALMAFDPKAKITAYNATFSYHDGVSHHQTPEFLNTIEMRVGEPSLGNGIKAWFSGPIGEARVIAVARKHYDGSRNAPTLAQFEQSLQAKYKNATSQLDSSNPVWEEAGKPSCVRITAGPNQSRPHLGTFVSTAQTFNNPNDIENMIEKRRARESKGLLPKDLATCGAFTFYMYHRGDPVKMFTAGMFDLGAMIATERSRNAWVDKFEAEATRKRQGQGQAPRL
jgi:hypothetical protein